MQLEWLISVLLPNSSTSLFSTPLSVTRETISHGSLSSTIDQKIKKRLIEYFAIVCPKELNADKKVQKAVAITAVAEEPVSKLQSY